MEILDVQTLPSTLKEVMNVGNLLLKVGVKNTNPNLVVITKPPILQITLTFKSFLYPQKNVIKYIVMGCSSTWNNRWVLQTAHIPIY
jgi:hypothetical protein